MKLTEDEQGRWWRYEGDDECFDPSLISTRSNGFWLYDGCPNADIFGPYDSLAMAAASLVAYVVDDAGNGREVGADPHAFARVYPRQAPFRHPSRLVGWGELFVAVHSYLDVSISDEEAVEMTVDYLTEIGRLPDSPPEFII